MQHFKAKTILALGLVGLGFGLWTSWSQTPAPSSEVEPSQVPSIQVQPQTAKVISISPPQILDVKKATLPPVARTTPKTLQRIRSSKLVSQTETEVDAYGVRSTLSVYQTDMKYPLVQLQEDWKTDENGAPKLVGWKGMAANQLLIRASSAHNSSLQRLLSQYGADLEETKIPGVYRVNFDGTDPMNLHELAADLSETEGVTSAEPNYIISIDQ